jgi:hypothetical protein
MKRKAEIKAAPGKILTLSDVLGFLDTMRTEVPTSAEVSANIRFNGTIRALSLQWDDESLGSQAVINSKVLRAGRYDHPTAG